MRSSVILSDFRNICLYLTLRIPSSLRSSNNKSARSFAKIINYNTQNEIKEVYIYRKVLNFYKN